MIFDFLGCGKEGEGLGFLREFDLFFPLLFLLLKLAFAYIYQSSEWL